MHGADHYREAEHMLEYAADADPDADPSHVSLFLEFAQVHATLAHAAAVIEAADRDDNSHRLVARPSAADRDIREPAYPGTPWGRAFYGDLHLDTTQEH